MIHINLLPVKGSKKQEAGRQQLVLLVVALLIGLGANYYWYSGRAGEHEQRQARVASTKADIAKLDTQIKEVKDIAQRQKEVEDKLNVLATLKKNRSGPVKVLDAVQTALPKKVWLADWQEKSGVMSLKGSALSHDDLAEFMSSLENVVDTPMGLGRVVSGGEKSKTSRVELSMDAVVHEFPVKDVTPFFTNIELKSDNAKTQGGVQTIEFVLNFSANYSA